MMDDLQKQSEKMTIQSQRGYQVLEIGDEIAKLEQLVEGNKIEAAQKTKNVLLMTLADSPKWNKQQRSG